MCTRTTARARSEWRYLQLLAFASRCTRYLSGVSATTRLQFNKETENCDKYQIQTLGFVVYDGMERQRSYALEVMYGSGKPLSVTVYGPGRDMGLTSFSTLRQNKEGVTVFQSDFTCSCVKRHKKILL